MDGELHGDPARITNAGLDPLRKFQMMTVARRQVAARLGDTNDRTSRLQLFTGHAVVHVAFDIQGSHVGVGRVIEPLLAAQATSRRITHDAFLSCNWMKRHSFAASACKQSTGGQVTQQGTHAKGPWRCFAAECHLVVQTTKQWAADTDPVSHLVGETAADMIAIFGRSEQGTEKQQETIGILVIGVEGLVGQVLWVTADLAHGTRSVHAVAVLALYLKG